MRSFRLLLVHLFMRLTWLLGWGPRFSMIKHPKLMEIRKERKIAVEVCPISFVILLAHPCNERD